MSVGPRRDLTLGNRRQHDGVAGSEHQLVGADCELDLPDGATVSELGRRLGVTKQAAAKTAAALGQAGYITRRPDTRDARATVLTRTARGQEMLDLSAAIFEQLRQDWVRRLGADKVRTIEDGLAAIVANSSATKIGDLPGWISSH